MDDVPENNMAASGNPRPARYLPIGDYGLISDCHSTALISREGSIDWACLRRFDAGSVFARLLDHDRGGFFSIRPQGTLEGVERRYLNDTMVLQTTLSTATGTLVLSDAFAMRSGGSTDPRGQLLRKLECVAGELDIEVRIEPRFDYGSTRPWLSEVGPGCWLAIGGDDALLVASDLDLFVDRSSPALECTVGMSDGDGAVVTAVSRAAHLVDHDEIDPGRVDDYLEETIDWWTTWSTDTESQGPHAATLSRSALVLKSLCCAPTGAIIAAPTTSLPEVPGGSANWDYRYCWVRDATLTLEALGEVGHHEVANGFRNFIMRSAAGQGDELQIAYGPYGGRRLTEFELDLEGWRGSQPVRIGNGAATQRQLDVFGHLLQAAHLWHEQRAPLTPDEWRFLVSVVNEAVEHRHDPDPGLWEMRGPPRHFVHSKVMIWVALDRGIALVRDHGLPTDVGVDLERWSAARDEMRSAVLTRGVDPGGGNLVQCFGSSQLDASLLKLPLVGFIEATDPTMVATVEAIQRELSTDDGFLRRYLNDADDVGAEHDGSEEGVFLLCTCWLVEVLALMGRHDEATELFGRLVATGNDLGLHSEEYDVEKRALLGNFPQAFTHLGLISAERRLREASGHAGRKVQT